MLLLSCPALPFQTAPGALVLLCMAEAKSFWYTQSQLNLLSEPSQGIYVCDGGAQKGGKRAARYSNK